MKKTSSTDFMLCTVAMVASVAVAVLAAIDKVETRTAIVFLGISVACVAMSLIDVETPIPFIGKSSKKRSKKRRK